MRNEIVAAISNGTLIPEAALSSGTLITAQLALDGVPSGRRTLAEAYTALRTLELGGTGAWLRADDPSCREAISLTLADCVLLAESIETLELAAPEFERLIACTGFLLGLDVRRKLTVGKTIYGRDREVDVLFRHATSGNRLAVEAKYQRVKGTADEKLPYAVLNQETLPLESVIVTGGGGFHPGALNWLCANARATDITGLVDWLTVYFAL